MGLLDEFKETVIMENGESFAAWFSVVFDNENPDPDNVMVSSKQSIPLKKHDIFQRCMGDGSFQNYEVLSNPEQKLDFYVVFAKPYSRRTRINVLGTDYTITFKNDEEVCSAIGVDIGECGGYCSAAAKEIVIANLDRCEDSDLEKEELRRCNLRHEIVHAFLNESGLRSNSKETDCWAKNEEMVDWIAIQGPKIWKAWQEAGAV